MADITSEEQVQVELERQRQRGLQPAEGGQSGQADSSQREESLGWVVSFCLIVVSLIGDAVEIMTIGTLGWFVGLLCDGILLVVLGFTKSGKKHFRRVLVGVFGELIPGLNILPLRTVFVLWAIIKSRSTTVQHVARLTSP
ncbi:MAG: hypothetical protein AAB864_01160 [Patescibacteria group bacterium]